MNFDRLVATRGRLAALSCLALVCLGCSTTPAGVREEAPRINQPALVEQRCAACHAVTLSDTSTHPEAPPLRDLFKRYAVEDLRRAFSEGVHVGHPDMPTYRLSPSEIDELLIYLEALNPCSKPSSDRAALDRCFAPL